MASWRRIGDKWCVQAPGAKSGGRVTVTRRDGASSQVVLGAPVPNTSDVFQRAGQASTCGRGKRELCANCGDDTGRRGIYERVDSSGIGGLVCASCAREPRWGLSFA